MPLIGSPSPEAILVVNNLFLVLATLSVGMRLYSHKIKKNALKASDYTIVAAWAILVGLITTLNITVTQGGLGLHVEEVVEKHGLEGVTTLAKATAVATVLWSAVMPLVKISVVLFYKTIFPNKAFHVISDITIVLIALSDIGIVLGCLLICNPYALQWDPTLNGSCGNLHDFYIAAGTINLFFDIWVVAMPMPIVWGLQMRAARKLGLMIVFGIGLLICAVSILRIVASQQLDLMDLSYSGAWDGLWTGVEPVLAIICACLPYLPAVFAKAAGTIKSSIYGTATNKSYMYSGKGQQGSKGFPGNSGKAFQRLQDSSVPLSTMHDDKSGNQATASHYSIDSEHGHDGLLNGHGQGQIKVTSTFNVQSA